MKRLSPVVACVLALAACKKEEPKPVAAPPAATPAPAAAPAPAPKKDKESDDACVGSLTQAVTGTFTINGQTYERKGHVLTRTSSDPDDTAVFGVISDIKDDAEANLKNIKAAHEFFGANKAEAILFLGDSAETPVGVVNVLKALAASPLPVFAIIGNRESKAHWTAGMAEVQKTASNLFDFTQIRLFNSDDVSVLSLPGYYNPTYLHQSDGCRYFPSDVQGLTKLLSQATATPLLISHGPPHMEGTTGLDRIHDNANVGDPALAEFLQKNPIPFGAFGNILESGGKATDLMGKAVIPQDTFVNQLYMNVGPTDSVTWQMLDGTTSEGMVGLLTVKGKQASYKIKRFGAGAAPRK